MKIDEFSPWQYIALCLDSSQNRENKHTLSLMFNIKLTKTKRLKRR